MLSKMGFKASVSQLSLDKLETVEKWLAGHMQLNV